MTDEAVVFVTILFCIGFLLAIRIGWCWCESRLNKKHKREIKALMDNLPL